MPKLPVTIFTGFLGAGKTTLLASLLASEHEQHFAIVVNEFGAVSVDDLLLPTHRPHALTVFKVLNSLIAYAGDDFLDTMHAIRDAAQHFDHVLIETSGLAVPTAVIDALQRPPLQDHFVHDATLTVVDTPLLLAGLYDTDSAARGTPSHTAAAAVFQQQLQCADVVVLNKIDQCSEDDLLRAETAIRTRASAIRFVEPAWQARLDARLVLGLHLNESRAQVPSTGLSTPGGAHLPGDGHSHSGLSMHEHGLLTHEHLHEEDPGWLSFVLRSPMAQVPETLQQALGLIAEQAPVLRVKGFAHIRDRAGHLVVQGVRTRITCTLETPAPTPHHHPHDHAHDHPHDDHAHAHPHDDHTHAHPHTPATMAELVFIGYHLNRAMVATALGVHTGTPWS